MEHESSRFEQKIRSWFSSMFSWLFSVRWLKPHMREYVHKADLYWINKQESDIGLMTNLKCGFETPGHYTEVYSNDPRFTSKIPNSLFGMPTRVYTPTSDGLYRDLAEDYQLIRTNKLTLLQLLEYTLMDELAKSSPRST